VKTIKEIADDLGVSKQAVRNKIAKLGLQTKLQTNGNTFAINKQQENAIKKAFFENELQTKNANLTGNLPQTDTATLQLINMLQKELEIKNRQIDELNQRLAEAHDMAKKAQQLHGADKVKELTDGKKPGLISRFFRKEQ